MGVAYDATSNVQWGTLLTSRTVTITSMATGAWCYCAIWLSADQSATNAITLTGWTRVSEANDATNNWHYGLFRRLKIAGDTTFTASWSVGAHGDIGVVSYSGVDTTTPNESGSFHAHAGTGTSFASSAITPTSVDRWGVAFTFIGSTSDSLTATPDAALTERVDITQSSGDTSLEIADSNGIVTVAAHTYTQVASGATLAGGGVYALFLIPSLDDNPLGFLPVGF